MYTDMKYVYNRFGWQSSVKGYVYFQYILIWLNCSAINMGPNISLHSKKDWMILCIFKWSLYQRWEILPGFTQPLSEMDSSFIGYLQFSFAVSHSFIVNAQFPEGYSRNLPLWKLLFYRDLTTGIPCRIYIVIHLTYCWGDSTSSHMASLPHTLYITIMSHS